jgi:GAF domain-containing protein
MAPTSLTGLRERIDHDPQHRALRGLAERLHQLPSRPRPEDHLQVIVDLARELTGASYGALSVTDEADRTQGFLTSGLTDEQLRRLRTPPQGHGPLGSLRDDGRPVRYENVQDDRRAFGFPPKHPPMRALLGVALWANGSVRGSLYVADREDGRPFDDDDERLLTTLAEHARRVIEDDWY